MRSRRPTAAIGPCDPNGLGQLRDWSYNDAKAKFATAGAQSRAAVQAAIDKHQARKG